MALFECPGEAVESMSMSWCLPCFPSNGLTEPHKKITEPITPPEHNAVKDDEHAKKKQPEPRVELKDLQKSFALTRKTPVEPPVEQKPEITQVKSVLDPFCVLPTALNREDEQLLQFC
jgi:hypothetical protein